MKYLVLILSLFLAISCSDSSDNDENKTSNLGKEGYNCLEDKTCDAGLICNRNNICEKEVVIDNSGKEGYECKADKSCNTGLICNSQDICEKEQVNDNDGKEGYDCKTGGVCDAGLECNDQNKCEKEDVTSDLGKEGYGCKADGTCNYELFCNSSYICEKENEADFGKEGKPCNLDYSCDAGLMCALEGICLNADDFHTADEGQKCRITDDSYDYCYEGFYCDTFGRCQLDCSPGNDSLCTYDGMFDFSNNYSGKYKLIRFEESTSCGENSYTPKADLDYDYFELTYEDYYGEFEYLGFHDCSNQYTCSSSEKSDYRVVEFDGQMLMEHAYLNDDGSCTYVSIDSKVRKVGDMVRLRYTFDEATIQNYTDECSDANVKNHYGEMECAKIRIIDGVKEF